MYFESSQLESVHLSHCTVLGEDDLPGVVPGEDVLLGAVLGEEKGGAGNISMEDLEAVFGFSDEISGLFHMGGMEKTFLVVISSCSLVES